MEANNAVIIGFVDDDLGIALVCRVVLANGPLKRRHRGVVDFHVRITKSGRCIFFTEAATAVLKRSEDGRRNQVGIESW